MFLPLLTGIGLSASAGLNAYLPLIVIAMTDRIQDRELLSDRWAFLSSIPGIIVLLVLVTIELVLDKSPLYRWNDGLQSVVRPVAGAVAALAATSTTDLHPAVAVVVGLVIAGLVHVGKGAFRRRFAPTMRRVLVPAFSLAEDLYVAVLAPIALVLPIAVPVIILPLAGVLGWTLTRPAVDLDPPKRSVDVSAAPATGGDPVTGSAADDAARDPVSRDRSAQTR